MDEKATKAYITYMSPLDFLKATTTSLEHENEIRKKALTVFSEGFFSMYYYNDKFIF